jgi:hypothetical protein
VIRPTTRKSAPGLGASTTISAGAGDTPVSARTVDPCDTSTRLPGPRCAPINSRIAATCAADWSGRPKRLPSAVLGSARPNASRAVSRQRHHGLDSTRETTTLRDRKAAPTSRA